jgi:hypothetical protein
MEGFERCGLQLPGSEDLMGAHQRNKIWMTKAPAQKFWFSGFMAGLHTRVGEIRMPDEMPDEILTIEEVHAIDRTLEREHIHARATKADQKNASGRLALGSAVEHALD